MKPGRRIPMVDKSEYYGILSSLVSYPSYPRLVLSLYSFSVDVSSTIGFIRHPFCGRLSSVDVETNRRSWTHPNREIQIQRNNNARS